MRVDIKRERGTRVSKLFGYDFNRSEHERHFDSDTLLAHNRREVSRVYHCSEACRLFEC